ncbi:hypothetical protein DFR35_2343 [Sulfurisoma sediminicola]|uniref:Spore coat protein U-like protein n=2 Tax=Sulfurisoma sediminicola TaxID=1381557 RepID=A0A497XCT0_9PROT|nr:hypothetical protein DFR35_2343 [Sulfurisoma sediminicola]
MMGTASFIARMMLAVAFCAAALDAAAAPGSRGFNVTSTLITGVVPPVAESAFCTRGPDTTTFGAVVTVVCATGAVVDIRPPGAQGRFLPIHGGAYRFLHVSEYVLPGMQIPGGIYVYTGVGTVTTWRIINLADRDYLEMLMGW